MGFRLGEDCDWSGRDWPTKFLYLFFFLIMSDKITNLTKAFHGFMTEMGLDMTDPSLKDTPKRVAKMFFNETCVGLYQDPPAITTFPNE